MNRLVELQRVFGGYIRSADGREWLETRISGLRALVIRRGTTFELAIFTPRIQELDPFATHREWVLDGSVPRLPRGFAFSGCRGGVLYASHIGEPSLEDLVATAWELSRWAHHDWHPDDTSFPSRRRIRWWLIVLVLAILWWLRR